MVYGIPLKASGRNILFCCRDRTLKRSRPPFLRVSGSLRAPSARAAAALLRSLHRGNCFVYCFHRLGGTEHRKYLKRYERYPLEHGSEKLLFVYSLIAYPSQSIPPSCPQSLSLPVCKPASTVSSIDIKSFPASSGAAGILELSTCHRMKNLDILSLPSLVSALITSPPFFETQYNTLGVNKRCCN